MLGDGVINLQLYILNLTWPLQAGPTIGASVFGAITDMTVFLSTLNEWFPLDLVAAVLATHVVLSQIELGAARSKWFMRVMGRGYKH